ncbi:tetratricopeptide repeat protein 28-like [Hydra vulgaris]|uniref:Kinesin light chain n=1 Tax=Hydra vulgaris TaxID=6087 RepID=A0ABM4DHG8_HYDVU
MSFIFKDQPHPDVASSLNNLGTAYHNKEQYDQAIKYYKNSLKVQRLIYKNEPHPDVAASLDNLGTVYSAKGQYDQAIQYHEDSLKIGKLTFKGQPHPDVARSFNNLGIAYHNKGRYDQAIQYHEDSLKIGKLTFKGQPHPDVARSFNNLGIAYHNKGRYDQAIQSTSSRCCVLNNLGIAYRDKGQYGQAIQYFEDSLKIKKLIFKDEPHPDVARSLNNLEAAYHTRGQYDQAIQYFEERDSFRAKGQYDQAFQQYEDSLLMEKLIFKDQPHQSVASSLINLGAAYSAKGQYNQAIQYFEDSLKISKLIFKDQPHPAIAMSLNNLGLAYAAKGEYKLAQHYGRQAFKILSVFSNHPYKNTMQDFMAKVKCNLSITTPSTNDNIDTDLHILGDFATNYGFNTKETVKNIPNFYKQKLDSNDYKLHYDIALSQNSNDINIREKIIEEYKLALMFFPEEPSEEEIEIKQTIFNRLSELIYQDSKYIELWLAVVKEDVEKVQELITAGVDLDNVPFMTTTLPLIQAAIKGDVEMVRLISLKGRCAEKQV